ncbi:MAG: flavodoxin family protein [Pseudomonadota bacterium]
MKVIAFNGSARKDGNTAILVNYTLKELEKEGIETEFLQLSGKKIHGCIACYKCMENKDRRCAVKDDVLNEYLEKMIPADGIILASPTYFADITTEIKALIDRAGFVGRANGDLFKRKVGAAIVAARRAGAIHAFDSLNHFFLINQMIIPASSYWNLGFGREKGEVEKDQEAIEVMKTLGQNMAWLLKKIHK